MGLGTFGQDIANSFHAGIGQKLVRFFLFAVVLTVLFGVFVRGQFRGFRDPQAMEYAQLARNLAAGRGYTTRCLRPADLRHVHVTDAQPLDLYRVPDTRHAPAYPAVLATVLRLTGVGFEVKGPGVFAPERKAVLPVGIVCIVLSAFVVLLLGRRLFDDTVAVTAMMLFVATESVLSVAIAGSPVSLAMLLVSLAILGAVVFVQNLNQDLPVFRWLPALILSILAATAASLTLYVLLALVPLLAVFTCVGGTRHRVWPSVVYVLLALLLFAPWAIRNVRVSGAVLGTAPHVCLNDTALYPDDTYDRAADPNLKNNEVAWALRGKLFRRIGGLLDVNLRTLGSGLVICFFLVSFFHRFEDVDTNGLRWLLLPGFFALAVTASLAGDGAVRSLQALFPLVVLYGTAFFYAVATRADIFDVTWYSVMVAVYIALSALPTLLRVVGPPARVPYPPYFPPFAARVSSFVDEGKVLCSDIPWATAWYGDQPSLLLPTTPAALQVLDGHPLTVGGLYLTSETAHRAHPGGAMDGWRGVLQRRVPADGLFRFVHAIALPPTRPDQMFLTDAAAWDGNGSVAGSGTEIPPAASNAVTNAAVTNASLLKADDPAVVR